MNSNYVAEIQATCCPNEQLVAGNMLLVRCKRGFSLVSPVRILPIRLCFRKIQYNDILEKMAV